MHAKSLQPCLTLCDAMGYGTPGSSLHGILQAGTLEWVAISSSRVSSPPRNRTHVSCVFCIGRQGFFFFFFKPLAPPRKPCKLVNITPKLQLPAGILSIGWKRWTETQNEMGLDAQRALPMGSRSTSQGRKYSHPSFA